MEQPGRTYLLVGDSAFKFGYNSKLKVNEVYGIANLYDYGSRMYDPRIGPGGFLSIDPIADSFPMLSPYQYASDNPIWNLDIDGLEGAHTTKRRDKPIVNNDFSGGGWPELFGGTRAKYVKLTKLPESDTHIKQRMSHYEHKKYHYVRDVENIDNPLTPRSRTVKERNESGITDFTPKYPTGTFSVDVEPISNGGQPGKITIGIVGPDGKQRDVQTVIQNGQTQHLEIKKFRLKPGERIFVQEETGKTGTVDKIKATHREVSKKRVLDQ
jgi:RHS repeat-associated protein